MKYILVILLLALSPISDLDKIATINKHKKAAREAYNSGEYEIALEHYRFLIDSMKVDEPEVRLNLANTLFKLQDTTRAIESYSSLYDTSDKTVRSVANQQLGIMYNKMLQKPDMALQYFKQALKDNPANEDARYNYEMLKKALKDQEEQQKDQDQQDKDKKEEDQQKQDQQKQDQQNKDKNQDQEQKQDQQSEEKQQDQEGKEGEENQEQDSKDQEQQKDDPSKEAKDKKQQEPKEGEPDEKDDQKNDEQMNSVADKLKDMKISEEKARMILEAMKNNEIQYFQQNKRKPTKKKDTSKPDW